MSDRPSIGAGKEHWDAVHRGRSPDQLTWYQHDPRISLELIERSGVDPTDRVVDVGGGSSLLCDLLLRAGFTDVTVVDVSGAALSHVRIRVGEPDYLKLVEADIGEFRADTRFALWHDRAVFHFLIDDLERSRYVDSLMTNLADPGYVVMATFGLEGPYMCSGLPVRRYGADSLAATLGDWLEPVVFDEGFHVTPRGDTQHFLFGMFKTAS